MILTVENNHGYIPRKIKRIDQHTLKIGVLFHWSIGAVSVVINANSHEKPKLSLSLNTTFFLPGVVNDHFST